MLRPGASPARQTPPLSYIEELDLHTLSHQHPLPFAASILPHRVSAHYRVNDSITPPGGGAHPSRQTLRQLPRAPRTPATPSPGTNWHSPGPADTEADAPQPSWSALTVSAGWGCQTGVSGAGL